MNATATKIKFNIGRGQLLGKLKLHRNVPTNPIVPICENIKIVIEHNEARLTTSDMNRTIETRLQLPYVSESVQMCVPYTPLLKLLEVLPEQGLSLTYTEDNYRLKIKAESGSYEFTGENPVDFPKPFQQAYKQNWLSVNSDTLREALENTLYAAHTDAVLRPAMTGVYVQQDGVLKLTTTDGHILRHTRIEDCTPGEYEATNQLIPATSMNILLGILPKDTPVELSVNQNFVWMECEAFIFSCVKIDERYPDYENAVPSGGHQIEIDRKAWLSVLKRLALFTNQSGLMAIEINIQSVSFSVENKDYGKECREKLDLDGDAPEILRIGVPLSALKETLSHFEKDIITLEYSAPNRALIFRENNNYGLIMPMMLPS